MGGEWNLEQWVPFSILRLMENEVGRRSQMAGEGRRA